MNELIRLTVVLCTLVILVCQSRADDSFPGLQELMDENQIRQTGIDKLTREELEALNNWLSRYMRGEKQQMETETRAIIEQQTVEPIAERKQKKQPNRILSRIDGEFNGWSDGTVFRLKNGEVWKQRYKSSLYYRAVDPEVEIRRNFMGFYILRIVGTSYEVGVTRVE